SNNAVRVAGFSAIGVRGGKHAVIFSNIVGRRVNWVVGQAIASDVLFDSITSLDPGLGGLSVDSSGDVDMVNVHFARKEFGVIFRASLFDENPDAPSLVTGSLKDSRLRDLNGFGGHIAKCAGVIVAVRMQLTNPELRSDASVSISNNVFEHNC